MFKSRIIIRATFAFLLFLFAGVTAFGQATAFSYQGKLTESSNPADGFYEFRFKLFNTSPVGTGTQIGSTIPQTLQVTNGVFSTTLNFGEGIFTGPILFLEVSVRPVGSPDPHTVLSPRMPIASAPYAVRSLSAATADNATQLGGQTANGFIQNTTIQQTMTNFNIGGSGTVAGTLTGGVVNAATQYQIGGVRMLAATGAFDSGVGTILAASNTFLGEKAGLGTAPNPTPTSGEGKNNSFFGATAGEDNTTGNGNSFFGVLAGAANTTGIGNSFFGVQAGVGNNTGSFNTTIGLLANVGSNNLTNATAIGARARVDQSNSIVLGGISGISGTSVNVGIGTTTPQHRLDVNGAINAATQYNIAGLRVFSVSGLYNFDGTILAASNTLVGESAGMNTTPSPTPGVLNGKLNSFFGANAGKANSTGNRNSFFGVSAGEENTGSLNSFFGVQAGKVSTGSRNAIFGVDAGIDNTTGANNAFFGYAAGFSNTTGSLNSFFGSSTAIFNNTGWENTFIGNNADFTANNTTGERNTLLGSRTRVLSDISNATSIGAHAQVDQSNSLVLGSIDGVNDCSAANNCASVNVGIGTTTPSASLHVTRNTSDIAIPVAIIGSAGNQAPLAFRFGASEAARIRADSSGNLVLATLTGASKNIFLRAGDDSSTDLFIQSSTGNVGIGDITPVDKLDVEGDIRVGTGTTGCVKDANASVIAGTCSSDARLKRSITPFPDTLDKLIRLRPVHFYWKADEYKDRAFGSEQSFGLIAQEVEEVLPELVTQDEQGMKAVRYNKLPLLMLQAIKELKAENDSLKQRLDEMSREREQIKQQQTQIESLKKIICLTHPEADVCK